MELQEILDAIPCGVIVVNQIDGNIIYTNDALYKLINYNKEKKIKIESLFHTKKEDPLSIEDIDNQVALKSLVKCLIKSLDSNFIPVIVTVAQSNNQNIYCILDNTLYDSIDTMLQDGYDQLGSMTIELNQAIKMVKKQKMELEQIQKKTQEEMIVAKSVQDLIMPSEYPMINGIDMFGKTIPSETLGGDYFDVISLNNNRLGLFICDVTGHGVPAALLTTMMKALVEQNVHKYDDPSDVLKSLNSSLNKLLDGKGMFVTAFYCILNLITLEIKYSSAGHDNIYKILDKSMSKLQLNNGLPLGIMDNSDYCLNTDKLHPGEYLIMTTDGLIEARNDGGELLDEDRLLSILLSHSVLDPKAMTDKVFDDINKWYKDAPPNDDKTFLALKISSDYHLNNINDRLFIRKLNEELKLGKYVTVLDQIDDMLKTHSVNKLQYLMLAAKALYHYNKKSQALVKLKEVLEIKPDYPDALYLAGVIYCSNQDYHNAKNYWGQLMEINPNYGKVDEYYKKIEGVLL